MSSDDRLMTIKKQGDKITIAARDLACTLTDLKAKDDTLTASAECDDEGYTAQTKITMRLLKAGKETFLVSADVVLRILNPNVEPKIDETHTNDPATITIYRKMRR